MGDIGRGTILLVLTDLRAALVLADNDADGKGGIINYN